MPILPDLSERNLQPELMDDMGLEESRLYGSLKGLRRINWICGIAGLLWPAMRELVHAKVDGPLRVLDVASGAGDVPIALWRRARREGLEVEIHGCDINPHSVAFATRQADVSGTDVPFFRLDAVNGDLPQDYDVITSSLFLHHLTREAAHSLLERAGIAAREAVLINDLVRSRSGFLFAYWGVRIITRDAIVHTDGPRSVEGAFTIDEAARLAHDAGLTGAVVTPKWPFRYVLDWRKGAS